jgi:hypothetical protein
VTSLEYVRDLSVVDRELIEPRFREFLESREVAGMVAPFAPNAVIHSLGQPTTTAFR